MIAWRLVLVFRLGLQQPRSTFHTIAGRSLQTEAGSSLTLNGGATVSDRWTQAPMPDRHTTQAPPCSCHDLPAPVLRHRHLYPMRRRRHACLLARANARSADVLD